MTLTSCFTTKSYYDLGLKKVENSENAKEKYSNSKITSFENEGVTKYNYEDKMIRIEWLPLPTGFSFVLENKSDNTIKIIWDQAVYVDENGSSNKVIHKGVKYTERNNSQIPSVIIKKAKIEDMVMPKKNVSYSSGQYGGWRIEPLFDNRPVVEERRKEREKNISGKNVRILLPLKIEDIINEYIFTFEINLSEF